MATTKRTVDLNPAENLDRGPIGLSGEHYGICSQSIIGIEPDEQSYVPEDDADIPLTALALDGEALQRFFRTCARARAAQRHTELKWVEYKDSGFLNGVYTLFFWKGAPGSAEIDFGVQAEIDEDTKIFTAQNERIFMAGVKKGGQSTVNVLKNMEENRQFCIDSVRELIRDQGKINSDVIKTAQQGLNRLAVIKLSTDIIIAVGAPFVVDIGYSLITTTLDEINKGKEVDAVLITGAKEGGKNVGQEIADHIGSAQAREIANEIAKFEKEIDSLNQRILRSQRNLDAIKSGKIKVRVSRKNRADKIAKRISNLRKNILRRKKLIAIRNTDIYEKKSFRKAPNAKTVLGKSVKWLFVANSVKGAVENFSKTYK